MSHNTGSPGYANLGAFTDDLAKDDVELALIKGINDSTVCSKCHVDKVQLQDGTDICPHCNALLGKCKKCKLMKPVFQNVCGHCRALEKAKKERVRQWGERGGNCCSFIKDHIEDGGKFLALIALMLIGICLLIPLVFEVEHLVKMGEKMADDVEGGVAPVLTEGGRILGYAGRNTASALRILETPLNFTGAVLDDAEVIVRKVADAIANPTAAFMAFNRVTGTMIICDDGTEYSWHPMVMQNGIVTNPYSGCVLHQTRLNGEEKARFFPGKAPQAGDRIERELTIISVPDEGSGQDSPDSGQDSSSSDSGSDSSDVADSIPAIIEANAAGAGSLRKLADNAKKFSMGIL